MSYDFLVDEPSLTCHRVFKEYVGVLVLIYLSNVAHHTNILQVSLYKTTTLLPVFM